MPWDRALASFAITAAVILLGGSVLLRYQRDRHHFLLMKTALEKGITTFPGSAPGWLISLRVGTLALVLGLGLIASGLLVYRAGGMISELPGPPAATGAAPRPLMQPAPPAGPGRPPEDAARPEPPRPPPELERWRRVQNQELLGLAAVSTGTILALLGIVRLAFARLERKYTADGVPSPSIT